MRRLISKKFAPFQDRDIQKIVVDRDVYTASVMRNWALNSDLRSPKKHNVPGTIQA
jgi:hypothetical protein